MKRILLHSLHLLALTLAFASCAPKVPKGTYLINGTLTNVEDSAVITLHQLVGESYELIGTDTLENGKFSFTGKIENTPGVFYLWGSPDFVGMFPFWVASEKSIKVTGSGKLVKTWEAKSTLPEQKALNLFQDKNRALEEKDGAIYARTYAIMKTLQTEKDDSVQKRYILDLKALYKSSDSVNFDIWHNVLDILEKEPVSATWYWQMEMAAQYAKYPDREDVLKNKLIALYEQKLSEQEKASPEGAIIAEHLFPPAVVKIGEDMADGDLYDLEGNLQHLSNYKGKYLLLDFWSYGCGPCLMAIPEMGEIAEMYRDQLTLVSINQDTKEQWEKASAEHPITWVNLNQFKGKRGLTQNYNARAIPRYVLISPDGKIVTAWSGYGPGTLKQKLAEALPK